MEPKVSIIIPTYKRSDRINRAIKSALNQDYTNFEVIVVDDNDPSDIERERTEKAVSIFNDNRKFIYLKHERNKNGSAARNTGIRNSTGDYITFLDDDDEYYENKISEQVKMLEKLSPDWGICYCGYDKIDQYGNKQVSAEKAEGNVLIQALTKNLFVGSGSNFMVRKNIVLEMNGFDESFQRNQDLEFMVRVVSKYKMKYVDNVGFLIHNEIREKKYSYEELLLINDNYRRKFSDQIDKLEYKDSIEVLKTLDLWDIRAAISDGKIREIIKTYKNSSLNVRDISKYLTYLIKRFFNKKSYGFKL